MKFPPKPVTDDERRSELLRLMSVRGYPNVFVLGCFARYVTIYSQQVRAINLVDALARSGVLSARSRVAVVGGGIAGMTAAAAAAVRGVGRVEVFEQSETTMRLQRTCGQRFVHPFLYDWPKLASGDETRLPVMNWKADFAREVVTRLDKEWEMVRSKFPGVLQLPRTSCDHIAITPGSPRPELRIGNEAPQEFDVLILAVGFGSDATAGGRGYWNDIDIDGPDVIRGGTWLVSGAGDGGLTDLMRLCILTFHHMQVLERVVQAIPEQVACLLIQAEHQAAKVPREGLSPGEIVAARYEHLHRPYSAAVDMIGGELDRTLPPRDLGKVYLVSTEQELVAGGASVLNRLIAYYLYRKGRFELLPGRIKAPPVPYTATQPGMESRFGVAFEKSARSKMVFDNVLVRHGPASALELGFPEIARRCRGLRRTWTAAWQHEDWTREQMYEDADFTIGAKHSAPLRVDFGDEIGAVVLSGRTVLTGQTLATRVKEALRRARAGIEPLEGRAVALSPAHLPIAEAFASAAAYERTVRALCTAEIAVFDLTGFPPDMMVLLGIRAAVRRGVTITVTQDDLATQQLPFDVAALNPIPIGCVGDYLDLATAMEAGFRSLRSDPNAYLDLPAFEALRQTGEHRTIPASQQILFLCWFNKVYRDPVTDPLGQLLKGMFDTKEPEVVTTLDSRSPQLLEQRLYAQIRRSQLCVVDWTGFRPNVFFELGVRLAVSPIDPLCIVYRTLSPDDPQSLEALLGRELEEKEWKHDRLRSFFQPIPFDVEERSELENTLREFAQHGMVRIANATLSPGRTHRVVSEALYRVQEPGGQAVEALLAGEAQRLAGPAVPEEGELPVLFGEALAGQVHRAAIEYLAAAWFYLDGRYRLRQRRKARSLSDDDPQLQTLLAIGRQLRDRLRNVTGREYDKLSDDINSALIEMEPRPPGTEIVDHARWLKARAIELRRGGHPDEAVAALLEAENLLSTRAEELAKERQGGSPSAYEQDVLAQLPHVVGSRGGVLREKGGRDALEESVAVYDQGFLMEQGVASHGILSSYNLVQRLVARALLDPLALNDEGRLVCALPLRRELERAAREIDSQVARGRTGDVYAMADAALIRIMHGGEGWEEALQRFLEGPPAPNAYALTVTREVIDQLRDACVAAGNETRSVADRLTFASEEIAIELNGTG